MANPVTISTNRLIKRLYKETLQFTREKYRDDAWQNANEALRFVKNFDGVSDMSVWGGQYHDYLNNSDRPASRTYDFKIETEDGGIIDGVLTCHSAGTVEDPFSSYDMTFQFWRGTERLDEEAKSKAQQRFFGMVRACQKGELENPSKSVKKAAKSMSKKDVKDFAEAKHKGLPNRVKKNKKKTNENREMINKSENIRDSRLNGLIDQIERYTWISDEKGLSKAQIEHLKELRDNATVFGYTGLRWANMADDTLRENGYSDGWKEQYAKDLKGANDNFELETGYNMNGTKVNKINEAQFSKIVENTVKSVLREKIEKRTGYLKDGDNTRVKEDGLDRNGNPKYKAADKNNKYGKKTIRSYETFVPDREDDKKKKTMEEIIRESLKKSLRESAYEEDMERNRNIMSEIDEISETNPKVLAEAIKTFLNELGDSKYIQHFENCLGLYMEN